MGETATNTMPGVLRDMRAVTSSPDVRTARALTAVGAGAVAGMLVSGFWNVRAVDGLGLALFVTPVIGAFEGKAETFATTGPAFGVLFGVLAGLAATFTASNLAGFSMLPALLAAHARAQARMSPMRLLVVLLITATIVGVVQGAFYGRLGPEGAKAFHAGPIRSAQSFTVFGALGLLMLAWAAVEAGLAAPLVKRFTPATRAAWRQPALIAALTGAVIGLFSVGRPLAVFREALLYAAQPASTPYAALTIALAVLATTVGVSVVLMLLAGVGGRRLTAWMQQRPEQARLIAAATLAAGGSFLIFYWAVSRIWPAMGRWGFALGWYA